tara:strand:+ start:680 stop:1687 length:1008 start_codon:yes stop_codon:yes gene_type:complete
VERFDQNNPFVPYKALGHLDRIVDIRDKGWCWPVCADIWLTDRCNHACPECAGFREVSPDMDPHTAHKFIDGFAETGGKSLTFTGGGEPLLHGQFVEILRYARAAGLDVSVLTNGDLWDERIARNIIEHATYIRVSLDGYNEESHAKMHGVKGRFHRVMTNILKYVELRNDTDSRCAVGVGYLCCADTIPGIVRITQECRSLGVDYIHHRPLYGNTDDPRCAIEAAKGLATDGFLVAGSSKYAHFDGRRHHHRCYGQWLGAVLKTSGRFAFCCCLGGTEFGPLSEGWQDVWTSDRHHSAVDNVNAMYCKPLCRWQAANDLLWRVKEEACHPNFIA